ncbi:MAG: helix-turn-helix domain-containing protein [Chitinophagaceae bacterium]
MITEIVDKITLAQTFIPEGPLKEYIEYMWEEQYIDKPANRILPKPGFTLLFNLGEKIVLSTPFDDYVVDSDVVLPRNFTWTDTNFSSHSYGIKFSFSLIAISEKICQSSLMCGLHPLKGLVSNEFIASIHQAENFDERVQRAQLYFLAIFEKYKKQIINYSIIMETIKQIESGDFFDFSLDSAAKKNHLSSKTLERYFLRFTGLSPKQVYCILRTRAALDDYFNDKENFSLYNFGFYDYSHFYKQISKVTGLSLPQYRKKNETLTS